MLQTYFKNKLAELGYGENLTIYYSLNYCQGDGMSFSGNLFDFDIIDALMARLIKGFEAEERQKMIRFWLDFGRYQTLEIQTRYNGCDYSSMRLEYQLDGPDDDDYDTQAINPLLAMKWHCIWDHFVDCLAADMKDVSQQLANDGYLLTESTPSEEEVLWEYRTPSFTVQLKGYPADFYWLEDWDIESIESLLDGKTMLADLEAIVLDEEEDIIGQCQLGSCSFKRDDKHFAGYKRDLCIEAIKDARRYLSNCALDENAELKQLVA